MVYERAAFSFHFVFCTHPIKESQRGEAEDRRRKAIHRESLPNEERKKGEVYFDPKDPAANSRKAKAH